MLHWKMTEEIQLYFLPISHERLTGFCHHPARWVVWIHNFLNMMMLDFQIIGASTKSLR